MIADYGTYVKVLNPLNFWVGSIAYHKFSYSCDTLNVSQPEVSLGYWHDISIGEVENDCSDDELNIDSNLFQGNRSYPR